jgi:hypothetical protein
MDSKWAKLMCALASSLTTWPSASQAAMASSR